MGSCRNSQDCEGTSNVAFNLTREEALERTRLLAVEAYRTEARPDWRGDHLPLGDDRHVQLRQPWRELLH